MRDRILPMGKLAKRCLSWTRAAGLINENSSLMAFVMQLSKAWRMVKCPLDYRERLERKRTGRWPLRAVAVADVVIWGLAFLWLLLVRDGKAKEDDAGNEVYWLIRTRLAVLEEDARVEKRKRAASCTVDAGFVTADVLRGMRKVVAECEGRYQGHSSECSSVHSQRHGKKKAVREKVIRVKRACGMQGDLFPDI